MLPPTRTVVFCQVILLLLVIASSVQGAKRRSRDRHTQSQSVDGESAHREGTALPEEAELSISAASSASGHLDADRPQRRRRRQHSPAPIDRAAAVEEPPARVPLEETSNRSSRASIVANANAALTASARFVHPLEATLAERRASLTDHQRGRSPAEEVQRRALPLQAGGDVLPPFRGLSPAGGRLPRWPRSALPPPLPSLSRSPARRYEYSGRRGNVNWAEMQRAQEAIEEDEYWSPSEWEEEQEEGERDEEEEDDHRYAQEEEEYDYREAYDGYNELEDRDEYNDEGYQEAEDEYDDEGYQERDDRDPYDEELEYHENDTEEALAYRHHLPYRQSYAQVVSRHAGPSSSAAQDRGPARYGYAYEHRIEVKSDDSDIEKDEDGDQVFVHEPRPVPVRYRVIRPENHYRENERLAQKTYQWLEDSVDFPENARFRRKANALHAALAVNDTLRQEVVVPRHEPLSVILTESFDVGIHPQDQKRKADYCRVLRYSQLVEIVNQAVADLDMMRMMNEEDVKVPIYWRGKEYLRPVSHDFLTHHAKDVIRALSLYDIRERVRRMALSLSKTRATEKSAACMTCYLDMVEAQTQDTDMWQLGCKSADPHHLCNDCLETVKKTNDGHLSCPSCKCEWQKYII